MGIEDWESAGALPLLYGELRQIGLESNVVELEAFGFTVVPPEKVGPPGSHLAVKEAVVRASPTVSGHWIATVTAGATSTTSVGS